MPIAPRFHIPDVRALALQIKRAPEKIRLQQIQAVEHLLHGIENETLYPLDYLVFRVTQYRGDALNQPMLLGSALKGDLVSLIAEVSWTMDLPDDGMLTVDEAGSFLHVSSRTISRLRGEGLVFYWVKELSGRKRLGCSEETLASFQERNQSRIESASSFSLLTKQEKETLVQLALEYKGTKRSLNDIAKELAEQSGRGHETVRVLLETTLESKHALTKTKPMSMRDARIVERARAFGIPWNKIEMHFQRSAGALRKAVARLRARRLKQLRISYVDIEIFAREDAEDVILGNPVVKKLIPPVLSIDPLHFGFEAEMQVVSDEIAMVSAMHLLKRRAKQAIAQLGYAPSEKSLDRIETDLRWAYLLQQQLLLFAIIPSIAVAVQHISRPLHELPPKKAIAIVEQVIEIAGDACGAIDASKGHSTLRTPSSIVDRVLSLERSMEVDARASTRMKIPSIKLPFYKIVPWSFLLPRSEPSEINALHVGWDGFPKTVDEIAHDLSKSANWVRRQLH
jgi:RNA polymerase primary sigma factor